MRNPRGAAPVCAASTSMVIVPAPIKVKISSLTAAVSAAVFWYARTAS
jgi:hypothetical protein